MNRAQIYLQSSVNQTHFEKRVTLYPKSNKMSVKNLLLAFQIFASTAVVAQTTILASIMHDGLERDYRLYVPDVYDGSESVPLVLNLHGYTSNSFEQEIYGDFRPIADTANFILIHPEGTEDNAGDTFWNAFGSQTETVDDLGFLSALIDTLGDEYNIDMHRVYSTGMSNGGFMSYKLACDLSGKIAAIASVTGAMMDPAFVPCNAVLPTPVMQIHGTADPIVPYAGSTGVLGAEAGVAYWVNHNNCNATAIETAVPDIDLTDVCTADHFLYEGGDEGSTVEFYRINGGGHTWAGSNPLIAIGVTNRDFSASTEIWRFFSRYSLNGVVGIEDERLVESGFSIYPNPSNGMATIQFENAENRSIKIQNSLGQIVDEITTKGSLIEVDIENSGVYFITVKAENEMFTKKLVVE
ncbi:MAG: polyhydroxybutyrate depolymerase [Bacteroidia bacterium]